MRNDQPYQHEKELLYSLAKGEEEALKAIYLQFWKPLYLSAYNVLKDKEACEDIVQEIFIRLWHRRETLSISTSLAAYLFTATRYQVFHLIKKLPARAELLENVADRFLADAPDVPLYAKDLQEQINRAVERLPQRCKHIYTLSRDQHLSYKAIASQLQISPKTVENQVSIALKKLQHALGREILIAALIVLVNKL